MEDTLIFANPCLSSSGTSSNYTQNVKKNQLRFPKKTILITEVELA